MTLLFLLMTLAQPAGPMPAPEVAAQADAAEATTRPAVAADGEALADRVLIVSIDGLRPDLAMRADMPNLRALMARGSYTLWAYTTPMSVTTPSHTSMLTGVTVERHGIDFNDDRATTRPMYPKSPTLFEVAFQDGRLTAMAAEKAKFVSLAEPGTVGMVVMGNSSAKEPEVFDRYVADTAALVADHRPDVLFVHFGRGDAVGHKIGWGTPEQIETFHQIDAGLGRVIAAYEQEGLLDTTAVIVSADHGGRARTHGADDWRSRFIPWIAAGPGIRQGVDLTSDPDAPQVNTEDTYATACHLLGLTPPLSDDGLPIDGKPVLSILESNAPQPQPKPGTELLAPTTRPIAAATPAS